MPFLTDLGLFLENSGPVWPSFQGFGPYLCHFLTDLGLFLEDSGPDLGLFGPIPRGFVPFLANLDQMWA